LKGLKSHIAKGEGRRSSSSSDVSNEAGPSCEAEEAGPAKPTLPLTANGAACQVCNECEDAAACVVCMSCEAVLCNRCDKALHEASGIVCLRSHERHILEESSTVPRAGIGYGATEPVHADYESTLRAFPPRGPGHAATMVQLDLPMSWCEPDETGAEKEVSLWIEAEGVEPKTLPVQWLCAEVIQTTVPSCESVLGQGEGEGRCWLTLARACGAESKHISWQFGWDETTMEAKLGQLLGSVETALGVLLCQDTSVGLAEIGRGVCCEGAAAEESLQGLIDVASGGSFELTERFLKDLEQHIGDRREAEPPCEVEEARPANGAASQAAEDTQEAHKDTPEARKDTQEAHKDTPEAHREISSRMKIMNALRKTRVIQKAALPTAVPGAPPQSAANPATAHQRLV